MYRVICGHFMWWQARTHTHTTDARRRPPPLVKQLCSEFTFSGQDRLHVWTLTAQQDRPKPGEREHRPWVSSGEPDREREADKKTLVLKLAMLRPESWQLYNDTLQIIPLIRAFGEEKGRGEKRNPLMLNQLEKEKSADTWDKLFTNRLKRKTENNRLHHIKSETSASFPQTNEAKWDSCFMTVQDVLKSLSLIWMTCLAIHPFQLYGPTGALWTGLQDCTWSSLIISSLASQQPSNIH